MKPWLLAAATIVPGGALVILAVWLRRRWLDANADETIDTLIMPPKPIYVKADEVLRARTENRRRAANGIRARAAQVESGTPVPDLLRRAK